jgi:hypothetical protein
MLRWGFGKKADPKSKAPNPAADEWSFLRQQPDHDADEMASVRSRGGAPEPPTAPEPGRVPSGAPTRRRTGGAAPDHGQEASASGPPVPLALQLSLGPLTHTQPLEGEVLIGRRDPERGLFPAVELADDDAVSRRHALIRVRNGGSVLQDLNSLNGTFVNGRKLRPGQEVALQPGDRIELGEFSVLRVIAAEVPVLREAAPATELTEEDRALGEMLRDALGGLQSAFEPASAPARRLASADVLDLALRGGEADGLLSNGLGGNEI